MNEMVTMSRILANLQKHWMLVLATILMSTIHLVPFTVRWSLYNYYIVSTYCNLQENPSVNPHGTIRIGQPVTQRVEHPVKIFPQLQRCAIGSWIDQLGSGMCHYKFPISYSIIP